MLLIKVYLHTVLPMMHREEKCQNLLEIKCSQVKSVNQYGADILRLWVASVDYREDVRISDNILKQVSDSYRRIRNTARFILREYK
jgi:isoleucyl-tRNA synthetase